VRVVVTKNHQSVGVGSPRGHVCASGDPGWSVAPLVHAPDGNERRAEITEGWITVRLGVLTCHHDPYLLSVLQPARGMGALVIAAFWLDGCPLAARATLMKCDPRAEPHERGS
jgi:hypothetical protein